MDIQTVFRNLVTNQYMPDFDYSNTRFTFRTVFHLSNHAYCVCMCCYEHEYLDYISDQGEIDEEKYRRILKCIVDGKCPHVNQVPEEYVKETSISGKHIEAAIGTIKALDSAVYTVGTIDRFPRYVYHRDLNFESYINETLTDVNLLVLAVLHNAATTSAHGLKFDPLQPIRYGKRNRENNANEIYIEQTKLLVLLAKQGNIPFSVNYLQDNGILDPKHITDILQLTLKHKLNKLQDAILDSVQNHLRDLGQICQLAIIWNRPEILDLILAMTEKLVLKIYFQDESKIKMLSITCHAFQRHECKDILLKYGISIVNPSFRNHYDWMIWLLTQSWQHMYSSKMKKVFNMGQSRVYNACISEQYSTGLNTAHSLSGTTDNSGRQQDDEQYSVFHHYHSLIHDRSKFVREPTPSEDVTHVLSWIIDNGLDINVRDSKSDSSPFEDFLSIFPKASGQHILYSQQQYHLQQYHLQQYHLQQYFLQHRQTSEVYIYNNPDLNQQKLIPTALRNDANLYNSNYFKTNWQLFSSFAGRGIPVKMDCKEHAIFGHDHQENFPLNFMAPLLVECGFAITAGARKDLENLQESLHPTEVDYLKFCLHNPRTLKLCCRDGLRKHFRGRLIHKFVEASEIPQGIKDYILLKPMLKSIPKQIFH